MAFSSRLRRALASITGLLSRRWRGRSPYLVPITLYLATFVTTTCVGAVFYGTGSFSSGLLFSAPLMTILTSHELGHFVQTRRYGVSSSFPYFIPLPLPPLGTFGAIILMRGSVPHRRALFDIGISGPLAGLFATLIFLVWGLSLSEAIPSDGGAAFSDAPGYYVFGEPLVMQWFARAILGYDPARHELIMHPIASAAWVGLLLTTLNLFPVSQLDGGHVFYALLRRRAVYFSRAFYGIACVLTLWFRLWNWALLLVLLALTRLRHGPTRDDSAPLGRFRVALGVFTLAFPLVGFMPEPLEYYENPERDEIIRIEPLDPSYGTPLNVVGDPSPIERAE